MIMGNLALPVRTLRCERDTTKDSHKNKGVKYKYVHVRTVDELDEAIKTGQ